MFCRHLITMHRLLYFLIFIGFLGCKKPDQAPVFKRVSNVEVTDIRGKNASLKADAYFFNPNDVSMILRQVNVDVKVDGKNIGHINQELKTVVPANADFKVPVNATIKLDQLGSLGSILNMFGSKNKIKVRYTGFVKVTIHKVPIRVPVDFEEEISF